MGQSQVNLKVIQGEIEIPPIEKFPFYVPLREVIYQHLKSSIVNGKLKPGQLLTENKIAHILSVSRTPVREAIRSLEAEKLVTILPGRKIVVSIPTLKEIEEIYDIRFLVEAEALKRISKENLSLLNELQKCIEEAEENLQNKKIEGLIKNNTQFHHNIIKSLANDRLLLFIDSLHDTISRYRLYSLTDEEWARKGVEQHKEIFVFLRKGENQSAVNIMRMHFERAKEVLEKMFQNET